MLLSHQHNTGQTQDIKIANIFFFLNVAHLKCLGITNKSKLDSGGNEEEIELG
jgi:hypothetical protein